jgi:Icc-related predicted phosphoesterase
MTERKTTVKVAAVADLHCSEDCRDVVHSLLAHVTETADVLLLCGDLTDTGLPEEAHILAREITTTIKIPIVGVLGNHDYESGKHMEVRHILSEAGVKLLDGETVVIHGVGFAGIKGFAGGFDRFQIEAWGEMVIKNFVQEAMDESLKLEQALAKLGDIPIVVLMHYSPIRATVEGEAWEIIPFLGSSRLEMPLAWFDVVAVFHGHAHHGSLEGHASRNIPVYNVALPLMRLLHPERLPYRVLEVEVSSFVPDETADSQ